MNKLKKGLLQLLMLGSLSAVAQNPGVNNVQVQPAPLSGVGAPCTLSFHIGNFAPNPITGATASTRMGFIATFTKCEPVPNNLSALSGTILTAFDVVYDAANRSFIGTQKANFNIPPLAIYTANIAAQVTQAAPITNLSIGLGVNVQPAAAYNAFNSSGDDYAAAFTYTGAPLSISPIAFDLKSNNCAAELSWKLSNDKEIASFEINESTNGSNYKVLETITAENGKLNYTYNVAHQVGGMKYYYIKAIGKNGEELLTSTKIIKLDCNPNAIALSPNPTTDVVNLQFQTEKIKKLQVKIIDGTGKVVHIVETQSELGNNNYTLDLTPYANGVYLINCQIGDSPVQAFKVTKL
jgi:hypothetical protein